METAQKVLDQITLKLREAKVHFERALDCKHTTFDDLYPYMTEHPQFFWYKRYVAWSELLTLVNVCDELDIAWEPHFTELQIAFIRSKVMSSSVLDQWIESNPSEQVAREQNL